MLHLEWCVRVKQSKRVIIVSNDTDTFALLLYYTPYFQALGMKEIWQQYGTGETHLHCIKQSLLGAPLAKTVIKAHILTGEDCMSKVGTKNAAMTCDPVQYLTNFGEADTLTEQDTALAEKYLVRVWAGATGTGQVQLLRRLRTSGKAIPVPALELMLSLPQVV